MLKEKLLKTINNTGMLREGDGVVVAFSGGGDSAALLHLLAALAPELKIKLFACHLNHKLRGAEADGDARFCRDFAGRLGVPLYMKDFDLPAAAEKRGLNIEEAGRIARTAFYRRAMRHFGANKAATAHHMNDQAETFLINLLRGSGGTGLSGIAPVIDGWLIRPLIECPKKDIEAYLLENGIEYRTDSTNSDRSFTRNRIRLSLIPLLEKEYNPQAVSAICQAAEIIRAGDELSAELGDAFYKNIAVPSWDSISLDRALFTVLPVHLKRILIRKAFSQIAGSGRRLTFAQTEDIILADRSGASGARFSLPFNLEAAVGDDKIAIHLPEKEGKKEGFEYSITIPAEIEIKKTGGRWRAELRDYSEPLFKEISADNSAGIFDAEKLADTITVRSRREGDRMQPLGMSGTKKLQDIFTDKKIPRRLRASMPVFESGGDIFWIPGVASGEKFKVSNETKKVAVFIPLR